MKTLLLDIDYTLMDPEGDVCRPHLREFLEYVLPKYNVAFYTAGSALRVTAICRVMIHQYGMDRDMVRKLQRKSLTRDNCKTIEIESGATVKCLKKAASILNVNLEDVILLDDNPSYDNPHCEQVIQAEGFMKDMVNDDYLKRIITKEIL